MPARARPSDRSTKSPTAHLTPGETAEPSPLFLQTNITHCTSHPSQTSAHATQGARESQSLGSGQAGEVSKKVKTTHPSAWPSVPGAARPDSCLLIRQISVPARPQAGQPLPGYRAGPQQRRISLCRSARAALHALASPGTAVRRTRQQTRCHAASHTSLLFAGLLSGLI